MPTVEELIEAFKKLPPAEQQKVMEWLDEKLGDKESLESEPDNEDTGGQQKP